MQGTGGTAVDGSGGWAVLWSDATAAAGAVRRSCGGAAYLPWWWGAGGADWPPATQGYSGGKPPFVVSSSQAAMMPLQPAYHGGAGGPTGPLVATQPSMAQQQHGGLGSAAGEGAFISIGAAGLYSGAAAGQGDHGRATMARPIGLADEEGDPLFELGGLISGEDSDDFGGVLR